MRALIIVKFMMYRFIIVVSIGLAVSSPLPPGSTEKPRIVGGHDIDIADAPYQVSLVNGGRHACGGSIVAPDLILTAAHCVLGTNAYQFQIRAGSSSSRHGGKLYQVADLIAHPEFSYSKMDKDVALLWLKEPLNFSDKVAAIELADDDHDMEDGDIAVVTGWGNIQEGGSSPSTLQKVEVPTVGESECKAAYEPYYEITRYMLCAGVPAGGKDACQGDSGGPLIHDDKLAGVVSWGIGCARPRYPGVYARVSALRDWIDENATVLRMRHLLRGS